MVKEQEEKIMMEVTKGEAIGILEDRLESNWKVDFEPLLILGPGVVAAYGIYSLLTEVYKYNEWFSLIAALPAMVLCGFFLHRQFRKRFAKAEVLYQQYKESNRK